MSKSIELQQAIQNRWSVLPVDADKKPMIPRWKMLQVKPASIACVERWESLHPPGWAVVTGQVSGLVVLDFDGDAGRETLQTLRVAAHVRTGSGGFHVYFRHPGWIVPT